MRLPPPPFRPPTEHSRSPLCARVIGPRGSIGASRHQRLEGFGIFQEQPVLGYTASALDETGTIACALMARVRKLLPILNAMVRDESLWKQTGSSGVTIAYVSIFNMYLPPSGCVEL